MKMTTTFSMSMGPTSMLNPTDGGQLLGLDLRYPVACMSVNLYGL